MGSNDFPQTPLELFYAIILLTLFFILALVWIRRKSKERSEIISDTVFNYTYKAKRLTYVLYVILFLVLITPFILGFVFERNNFLENFSLTWIILILAPILGVSNLWIANWIYKDSKKRGLEGTIWGFGMQTLLAPLVLVIYLRRRKKLQSS